jgi:hypothetical protein
MAIYERSAIHAAKIMTLEIRTGNHSSIWSIIAEDADTMTWWPGDHRRADWQTVGL